MSYNIFKQNLYLALKLFATQFLHLMVIIIILLEFLSFYNFYSIIFLLLQFVDFKLPLNFSNFLCCMPRQKSCFSLYVICFELPPIDSQWSFSVYFVNFFNNWSSTLQTCPNHFKHLYIMQDIIFVLIYSFCSS